MTESLPPLKIKTVKKRATIFLIGGATLEGAFFLSPVSQYHPGEETLLELLGNEREYVPFETGQGVVIINKKNIVKILLDKREKAFQCGSHTDMHIVIHLCDGGTVEGKVYYSMPETHSRLSDFLNDSKEFFQLFADGHAFLINAHRVNFIEEIDSLQGKLS